MLQIGARQGDPNAIYGIAYLKDHGYLTEQDKKAAGKLFKIAAERRPNMIHAETAAFVNMNPQYGPVDFKAATYWSIVATKLGSARGLLYLYVLIDLRNAIFEEGFGPKDSSDLETMLRVAAQAGDMLAEFELGQRIENNHANPKDLAEAIEWYRKAVAHGSLAAKQALSRLGIYTTDQ